MRSVCWLTIVLLGFSGCIDSGPDTTKGSAGADSDAASNLEPEDSPAIAAGTDLGELTYTSEGTFSIVATQPDCIGDSGVTNNHEWEIPAANREEIGWLVQSVEVTLTKQHTTPDLDLILLQNGVELDARSETGPDGQTFMTVSASSLPAADLQIRVKACTTAPLGDYTLEGTATMVAA